MSDLESHFKKYAYVTDPAAQNQSRSLFTAQFNFLWSVKDFYTQEIVDMHLFCLFSI